MVEQGTSGINIGRDKDLIAGFDAFGEHFAAQLRLGVSPEHEHNIHFCLGLGFQAAYDLPPGSLIFERDRIDLFLVPRAAGIEVKYSRVAPFRPNPGPKTLGTLLADVGKLAASTVSDERFLVLVADRLPDYLRKHRITLLPLETSVDSTISEVTLQALTPGVVTAAKKHGWATVTCRLIWSRFIDPWHLLAWRVTKV